MVLLDAKEASQLDNEIMEKWKIKEETLMENAGAKLVQIMQKYIKWENKKISIICGSGNNGGDGYVAARYLKNLNAKVKILENGNMEKQGKAAKLYREIAHKMGIPIIHIQNARELKEKLYGEEIIIDALIGSGLKKSVQGEKLKIIETLNEFKGIIISVDIPSGLSATSGTSETTCVHADYTITMGTLKRGQILYPGIEYCGKTLIADIGYPYAESEKYPVKIFDKKTAKKIIPKRNKISHKGKNGHIGIFAGACGMEGAALLAALGALYAGSGKISLNTVEEVAKTIIGKIPEIMVNTLEDSKYFTKKSIKTALENIKKYDTTVIGPGLGRNIETQKFVEEILMNCDSKIIVDADAIYAISKLKTELKKCKGKIILTPHVGEFSTLTGKSKKEIEENRIDETIKYAKENKVTLVLKGYPTIIADENGNAFVNISGNPGMASGGMGDVLCGITATMNAQIENTLNATAIAVYMHGKSGDILLKEKSIGYTASKLAENLPNVRKILEQKK